MSLEFYPIGFCEAGRAPADGPLSSFERSGGSRRSRACGRRPPRRPCTSRSGAGVSRQHVLLAPAPGRSRRSCRCRSWSNGSRRPTTHRQPHPRARAPAPAQPLHGARRATLKPQRVAEKRLPKRHHRTIVCQTVYTRTRVKQFRPNLVGNFLGFAPHANDRVTRLTTPISHTVRVRSNAISSSAEVLNAIDTTPRHVGRCWPQVRGGVVSAREIVDL